MYLGKEVFAVGEGGTGSEEMEQFCCVQQVYHSMSVVLNFQ